MKTKIVSLCLCGLLLTTCFTGCSNTKDTNNSESPIKGNQNEISGDTGSDENTVDISAILNDLDWGTLEFSDDAIVTNTDVGYVITETTSDGDLSVAIAYDKKEIISNRISTLENMKESGASFDTTILDKLNEILSNLTTDRNYYVVSATLPAGFEFQSATYTKNEGTAYVSFFNTTNNYVSTFYLNSIATPNDWESYAEEHKETAICPTLTFFVEDDNTSYIDTFSSDDVTKYAFVTDGCNYNTTDYSRASVPECYENNVWVIYESILPTNFGLTKGCTYVFANHILDDFTMGDEPSSMYLMAGMSCSKPINSYTDTESYDMIKDYLDSVNVLHTYTLNTRLDL